MCSKANVRLIMCRLRQHREGIGSSIWMKCPRTFFSLLHLLTREMVMNRLVKFKKSKSILKRDIFPCFVSGAATYIDGPLTHVNNTRSRDRCPFVISASGSLDLVDLHGVGSPAGTIRD